MQKKNAQFSNQDIFANVFFANFIFEANRVQQNTENNGGYD